jgi:hypothetical protein
MTKRQIVSTALAQPSGVFSHATTIAAKGTIVFVSGMVAKRPDGTVAGIGDVTEQTRQVCENLRAAMAAAGGTLRRLRPQHGALRLDPRGPSAVLQRAAAGVDDGRGDQDDVAGLSHRDQRDRGLERPLTLPGTVASI